MHSGAIAIFAVFFFESSVIGQWIPRIPDIKSALHLSDFELGLALLSMPMGTLFGFTLVGKLIEYTGLRNACRIFLPAWALLFIAPAFAQSFGQLVAALAVCGLAIGFIETAMNTEAARIEKSSRKRLMSRCHGFWSLGTMIGALTGGMLAQSGWSISNHFLLVMPFVAVAGYISATALPRLDVDAGPSESQGDGLVINKQAEASGGVFRLPGKAIILLCMMPMGIMMVEGAFIDWSAVFMRDVLAADPLMIALAYSSFSLVMALVRLSGDYLSERFGERLIVRVSGLASTLGITLFALAPSTVWAFIAAAFSGAGVAIVFPLAVTAAANRPGRNPADNVAALNMIAFSAFLIAPPIIGFLSEWLNLRWALLALAPIAFLTFLLAGEVEQSPRRH